MEIRKKVKAISLADYGTKVRNIDAFKREIQNRLTANIFEINSKQDLYFLSLTSIKEVRRSVKNDHKSIEKNIITVLRHFKFWRKEAKLFIYTDSGWKERTVKEDSPIELFEKWIIGYDKLPSDQLKSIKPIVEKDLIDINKLISEYEQHDDIVDFYKGERFKNKAIPVLYTRCLKERQTILDYYLKGMYEEALSKSLYQPYKIPLFDIYEKLAKPPYDYGYIYLGRQKNFDYRKIDRVTHRLNHIYLDETSYYQELYYSDKEKFYKKLFKVTSFREILKNINDYISLLPLANDRTSIFKELQRLFKSRRWISFYALALPQVEGLFTEMMIVANPKVNTRNALPDKVKAVRPDYFFSDPDFDYYEFVLPDERNSFAHTGYTENFRLKSFDLLTDLEHVLYVFASLNNPLVKVIFIIRKRDLQLFKDLKYVAEYFRLLKNLKSNHKHVKEIENFNENFLKKECFLELLIQKSSNDLVNIIEKLSKSIDELKKKFPALKNTNSIKDTHQSLINDQQLIEEVTHLFALNDDLIKNVFDIHELFKGYKFLYKKDIKIEVKKEFELWSQHNGFIENLLEISKLGR